jgi:hypothetical protein
MCQDVVYLRLEAVGSTRLLFDTMKEIGLTVRRVSFYSCFMGKETLTYLSGYQILPFVDASSTSLRLELIV